MDENVWRCAIIDVHPPICRGYESILNEWPHGKVVLTACSADEYYARSSAFEPIDLVLVDMNMPVRDGYHVLEWMSVHQPNTKALVTSFLVEPEGARRAVRLGACGIILKGMRTSDLFRVLDSIRLTGFHMDGDLHKLMLEDAEPVKPDNAKILKSLTPKQRLVLERVCDPDTPTYRVIGDRAGMSLNTVHTHRKRLFAKFGVTSKIGLFKLAADWRLFKRR